MILQENYRIVVQMLEDVYFYEYEDVIVDFMVNFDFCIYGIIRKRFYLQLVFKFDMVFVGLSEEECFYVFFFFVLVFNDEFNIVLSMKDVDIIQKMIKVFYEFYWDVLWKDDFSVYWEILRG